MAPYDSFASSGPGMGYDGFKRKRVSHLLIQKAVKKYAARVGLDIAVTVHSCQGSG